QREDVRFVQRRSTADFELGTLCRAVHSYPRLDARNLANAGDIERRIGRIRSLEADSPVALEIEPATLEFIEAADGPDAADNKGSLASGLGCTDVAADSEIQIADREASSRLHVV